MAALVADGIRRTQHVQLSVNARIETTSRANSTHLIQPPSNSTALTLTCQSLERCRALPCAWAGFGSKIDGRSSHSTLRG